MTDDYVIVSDYLKSKDDHDFYKVVGDGKVLVEGKFAPWILGKAEIDVDLKGVGTLEIETRVAEADDPRTIFLGNLVLVTRDGIIPLSRSIFDGETGPVVRMSVEKSGEVVATESTEH